MGFGASRRSECRSPSATANWSTLGSHKVEPAGLLKGLGVWQTHVVFRIATLSVGRGGKLCALCVISGPKRTFMQGAANGRSEPKAAPKPITLTTPKQTFVLGSKHPCGDARWLEAFSATFALAFVVAHLETSLSRRRHYSYIWLFFDFIDLF
jgi:hypothetical protein